MHGFNDAMTMGWLQDFGRAYYLHRANATLTHEVNNRGRRLDNKLAAHGFCQDTCFSTPAMAVCKTLGTFIFSKSFLSTDYQAIDASPTFGPRDGACFKHEAVILVKGKLYARHFPDGSRAILDMASEPHAGDMVLTGFDDGFIFGFLRRFVDGVIELYYPDAHYPRIHRQTRQVFKVVGAIFPKQGKRGQWSSNQQP